MQSVREQYQAVAHSKNAKEFFRNIPETFIEILAAVPFLVFILTVIHQLIVKFTAPYGYSGLTRPAMRVAAVVGAAVIILHIGKQCTEGVTLRRFAAENMPLVFFLPLMLWMLLSTCVNGFTQEALHGDGYRCESLFTFLLYFSVYFFCASIIHRQRIKAVLCYAFLAVSLILNAVTLILTYIVGNMSLHYENTIGVFDQFNHYGYYLLLTVILSCVLTVTEKNKLRKGFSLVCFLVGSISLVLNDTFGCFLSCCAALVFVIIAVSLVQKRFSLASAGMMLLFWAVVVALSFRVHTVLGNFSELSNDLTNIAQGNAEAAHAGTGRMLLWRSTLGYIRERPVFGFGVEGIAERLLVDSDFWHVDRPHNEYLQYAAFFGIPGLLLYLGGVLTVFLAALRRRTRLDGCTLAALCTAAAYLCSAFFGNTMHYTAPYFFMFLGLGFGLAAQPASAADRT